MNKIKTMLLIIAITIISLCGFGGGCLIWYLIALIIKPSPTVFEIMFYITTFVPIPFCWWIAPKISEKFL